MSRRFLGIGTRRGIRVGPGGSSPAPSLDDLVTSIINSYGTQAQRAWFRSDVYTVDGATSKVGAFVDRLDASHVLAQGNESRQVSVPSADPALSGALSSTFSSHFYDSNRAPVSWRPYHDGSGCTSINVFVPGSVATGTVVLLSTRFGNGGSGDVGMAIVRTSATVRALVQNGATNVISVAGGSMSAGVGYWSAFQFMTGRSPDEATITLNGSQVAHANAGSAPPSGDPSGLRIGSNFGPGLTWAGRWAESILIPGIISSGEMSTIQAYFLARYGIAA